MRLNAFLAKAGISSRRGADEHIKGGRVTVNGKTGELNDVVGEDDVVIVDGKLVKLRKSRYILLYKPAGYISTMKDPKGRRKVIDLVEVPERVVPVGRLDYDTTGIILLTNDGELSHRLAHPSYEIDKVYEAEVAGDITAEKLQKLSVGVRLDDGVTSPCMVNKLSKNKIKLTIHEGKKHQVKRMLAAVGLPVIRLHRSGYGGLGLEGLGQGQWRDLTDNEVQKLQHLVYS